MTHISSLVYFLLQRKEHKGSAADRFADYVDKPRRATSSHARYDEIEDTRRCKAADHRESRCRRLLGRGHIVVLVRLRHGLFVGCARAATSAITFAAPAAALTQMPFVNLSYVNMMTSKPLCPWTRLTSPCGPVRGGSDLNFEDHIPTCPAKPRCHPRPIPRHITFACVTPISMSSTLPNWITPHLL